MLASLALAITPPGSTYNETAAIQKATEAAYIQSGASAYVNGVQNQAISYAKSEAKSLGVARYLAVVGGAAQVIRTQSLTFHISPSSVATVKPDFASLTLSF